MICYRCPKSVVELAASIYPGIEASSNANDGIVETIGKDLVDGMVRSGDLILCRMTAPLVSKCLELLRAGKRANVRGKDLGTTFASLIEKVEKFSKREFSFENLETCVRKYEARQIEILSSSNADENESKVDSLQDKIATLLALHEAFLDRDGKDLDSFLAYIKSFFSEDKDAQIILSTGHRAKGLEYPRVFILASDRPVKAKTPEAMMQEMNLKYVMYTRAQEELYLVVDHVAVQPQGEEVVVEVPPVIEEVVEEMASVALPGDMSVEQYIIHEEMCWHEVQLREDDAQALRSRVERAGLSCRRNAKEPMIQALLSHKRSELEANAPCVPPECPEIVPQLPPTGWLDKAKQATQGHCEGKEAVLDKLVGLPLPQEAPEVEPVKAFQFQDGDIEIEERRNGFYRVYEFQLSRGGWDDKLGYPTKRREFAYSHVEGMPLVHTLDNGSQVYRPLAKEPAMMKAPLMR